MDSNKRPDSDFYAANPSPPRHSQSKSANLPPENPVVKKVLTIVLVTLALMVPLCHVERQVNERSEYESVARREVAKGWGESVGVKAPVAYLGDSVFNAADNATTIQLLSQKKKRGVFVVPVYTATITSTFTIAKPVDEPAPSPHVSDRVVLGIFPVQNIQTFKAIDLSTGKELTSEVTNKGIQVRLSSSKLTANDLYQRKIQIVAEVRGTYQTTYYSNAVSDTLKITGNWAKPKFSDTFPMNVTHSKAGFSADWNLRGGKEVYTENQELNVVSFEHYQSSTDYAKVTRASKYGLLFVVLTFLLIFVVELISKAQIHPLQYALVGAAITVFYLLLLALSEVIAFDKAYAISTIAVTGAVIFYVRGFIQQTNLTNMILAEQLGLSGFFYLLLTLEERAFLVGSLGVFATLVVLMAVTRKFDWYTGKFRV